MDGHDYYVQSLPLLYVILVTCSVQLAIIYGVIVIQKGISELKTFSTSSLGTVEFEQLVQQQEQKSKTARLRNRFAAEKS